MSVSGIAEQLISTKGASRRGLRSWIARAANSLPVPVAPVTRTEASVGATLSMIEKTFLIAGEWPTSETEPGETERVFKSKWALDCLVDEWLDNSSVAVGVAKGIDIGGLIKNS